jgi:hypothetical protein
MTDATKDQADAALQALLTQIRLQAADLMLHPRVDAILQAVLAVSKGEDSEGDILSTWRVRL